MAEVMTVFVFIAGAVVYSLATYLSKRAGTDEPFQPRKFIRTLVLGVIVGLYAYQRGIDMSLSEFESVAQASGATVLADQVTKLLWRVIRRQTNGDS